MTAGEKHGKAILFEVYEQGPRDTFKTATANDRVGTVWAQDYEEAKSVTRREFSHLSRPIVKRATHQTT